MFVCSSSPSLRFISLSACRPAFCQIFSVRSKRNLDSTIFQNQSVCTLTVGTSIRAVKMVSFTNLALAMLVSVAAVLAQATEKASTAHAAGSVYIVHMEKPDGANANGLEALHLETLSSVFGGSQEKAKESILYSYTNAMNGFSAKLTPEQVAELSTKPGVLAVNPQGVAHVHGKVSPHTGASKPGLKSTGP